MKQRSRTIATVAAGICLLCVSSATAQNLISNGDFSAGLVGWTSTADGSVTITADGALGNPAGSAALARTSTAAVDNGNHLYQAIPVTLGQQYKLDADWKGDLLNGGSGRNWAEVFVSFASSPSATPANIVYKKATDGGPNEVPMPWDWESILLSTDGGPADGIFTATDNYMVVGLNLGGRAGITALGYYNVDNVSVTPWPPSSEPVFTNIMRVGGDVILQGTNGPSRGAYEMLRSPDLAQSLSNWPGVGIDSFDFDGNFSFTNTLPGDEASFYRLEVLSIGPVSPVEIIAQPQDFTTSVGYTATFSVTADGTAPLTYRWYFNTNTLLVSGPSATLSLPNLQLTNSGKISVSVSNLLGAVPSDFATLTVTNSTVPPSISDQPEDQSVTVGQTANFSVTAEGALPLNYQWFYNTNTLLINETNNMLTLLNVDINQAGNYSVTVTNLFGSLNSAFAELAVNTNGAVAAPDGYGASATGGGNTAPITVSTAAAFQSAVNNNTPAVIVVDGRLNVGDVAVGSNKTIMGADTNSGLYGGVVMVQGNNYIFQNLSFGPGSGGDVMEISGATDVFITKCEFHDSGDELCSIVRAADYVTVSWSKFYFDNPDSHSFAHLIGNSDDATDDRGKLHVTLHHNWYAQGVRGRMPRVRFGHIHIYNNYYNSVGNDYCIGTGKECHIRVENTHFDTVNDAWDTPSATPPGDMAWANLLFTGGSTQPTYLPNTFPLFVPPYAYTMDPVGDVESLVKAGAGNVD